MSRTDKDTSMPALPGMNTYVFSTLSSPSPASETSEPLSLQHDATDLDTFPFDALLQRPASLVLGPNEPSLINGLGANIERGGTTASGKTSEASVEPQGGSLGPTLTSWADGGYDVDMLTEEKPSPLVDLTALLAEMSPYRIGCRKLPFANFAIIPSATRSSSPIASVLFYRDPAAVWPMISPSGRAYQLYCSHFSHFITLTRLYSSIFGYIQEQVSRTLEAHITTVYQSCPSSLSLADINIYCGLLCVYGDWDPTKKAVSMLLSSLGGAEGELDLLLDVRIVKVADEDKQGESTSRSRGTGGDKTVLFEEGLMATLTNGHLNKTVRKQAKSLREKIEEVEELLKEATDLDYMPRHDHSDDIRSEVAVGSCVAGLLQGLQLKRNSTHVVVLEQDPSKDRHSHESGVTIGPSVVSLLNKFDTTGRAAAIPARRVSVAWRKRLLVFNRPSPRSISNWRCLKLILHANFDGMESETVPEPPQMGDGNVEYRSGKRVFGVSYDKDKGRITVQYVGVVTGEKNSVGAAIVIIADSVHSSVRKILQVPTRNDYAGYIGWRGTVSEHLLSQETIEYFSDR
ncbi:MAG: hypothetical protein Q9202_006279 [Teloschistes flavicans]